MIHSDFIPILLLHAKGLSSLAEVTGRHLFHTGSFIKSGYVHLIILALLLSCAVPLGTAEVHLFEAQLYLNAILLFFFSEKLRCKDLFKD